MIMGDFMRLSSSFTELTEQDSEHLAGGFFFKKIGLLKKPRRCFRLPKFPRPPLRPPNGPPGKDDASLDSFSAFGSDYESTDFFSSDFD